MEIDHEKTQKLAEKYDSEIRFRPLDKTATWIVSGLLVTLSLFHYYTAVSYTHLTLPTKRIV